MNALVAKSIISSNHLITLKNDLAINSNNATPAMPLLSTNKQCYSQQQLRNGTPNIKLALLLLLCLDLRPGIT